MKKSGIRHVAREYALRVLYSMEMRQRSGEENPLPPAPNWWSSEDHLSVLPEAEQFARTIYQGVLKEVDDLDRILVEHSKNWRLTRMGIVDRNILRLSVYELIHEQQTSPNVILDEALELAKCYGTEESARFVNGILDSVLQEINKDKPLKKNTVPSVEPEQT